MDKEQKLEALLRESGDDQAIVFVSTKRMCDTVAMRTPGSVSIHGDKDQRERELVLADFKAGKRPVMIATDVAARGTWPAIVRRRQRETGKPRRWG